MNTFVLTYLKMHGMMAKKQFIHQSFFEQFFSKNLHEHYYVHGHKKGYAAVLF